MIDKLRRFETAEYILPPFVGDVFKEEKDEQVLIQKLNISKSGILKMIQNLGAGAVAGTAAGAAVYAAEGASLSLVAHILVGKCIIRGLPCIRRRYERLRPSHC